MDMTDADLGRCLPILQRSGMLGNERARVGNRRDSWPGVGFDGTRRPVLYLGNIYPERFISR